MGVSRPKKVRSKTHYGETQSATSIREPVVSSKTPLQDSSSKQSTKESVQCVLYLGM